MDGSLRGVPVSAEPVWLAPKLPVDVRHYQRVIDPVDAALLTGLSLAAAPSGSGELTVSGLGFASGLVSFTLSEGQPGRCYTLLLTATRSDGMVSDYRFRVHVDCVLPTDQAQAVPSAGFGTPVTLTAPGIPPVTPPVLGTMSLAQALTALGISAAIQPVLEASSTALALTALGIPAVMQPVVGATSLAEALTAFGIPTAMQPVVGATSLAQALTALGISPAMQPTLEAASTALALTALGIPPVMQPVVEAGSLNTAVNLLSVGATNSAVPLTPYMFGAVGDGITNDATAMNNWYAALTSGGRRGYLPAGTFLCPSGLVWDLALVQRSCLIIDGAGPNLAIINVTGAAGVGLQIQDTGSGGAAFYTKFTNFSVAGSNSAGPVFAVMRFNGGDALNGGEISNVVVNNASTASGAIGIQVNECATCFFNMTTNTAGHGTALQIAGACGFCCFQGSYSGSHIAVWITNNSYCFSNTFISNDYEVVDINVQCDSPNAARNTWIGGQFDSVTGPLHGGAGSGCFNSTAGSNHIFINPNIDAAPGNLFLPGGYVGVKITGSGNDVPTTPAVPASGVALTNATGYMVNVIIYNGTVTYVAINGSAVTISAACAANAGSFLLQPGDTIAVTYTGTPAWLWKPVY